MNQDERLLHLMQNINFYKQCYKCIRCSRINCILSCESCFFCRPAAIKRKALTPIIESMNSVKGACCVSQLLSHLSHMSTLQLKICLWGPNLPFPPVALLGKVIEKLKAYLCKRESIYLIVPGWPSMVCFWDLVALSGQTSMHCP